MILEPVFISREIDANIYQRILKKSYKENCPIPLNNLRYLNLSYIGFDGNAHMGEMIVHSKIADKVCMLFKELYHAGYPIEKIKLVDEYDADDEKSMADNNSSCFNYRTIDSSDKMSNHSLGLAIDINPLYNPYVRFHTDIRPVLPVEGEKYADRTLPCSYMIHKDDVCYNTFLKYGFTWGGDWTHAKDYQHFEIVLSE